MTAPVVRAALPGDAAALAAILNPIIAAGGTTAIESPLDPATLAHWFIDGPDVVLCHVAELDGAPCGFQSLSRHGVALPGWADIGTFTRQVPRRPGVGKALFAATRAAAVARGLGAITATIRADNARGLAFYRGLGFVQTGLSPGVRLRDGTPVDRLHHRLDLAP